MPDHRDAQSLLDAAGAAAEGGDYAAAEVKLREAADVQEATLGPTHPDLANTLNNLAVVCESTGKTSEAERCYRRALEIATVALDPDHPFVTTSRDNLRQFCEARGLPFDTPTAVPAAPTPSPRPRPPAPVAAPPTPPQPKPRPQPRSAPQPGEAPAPPDSSIGGLVIGAVAVSAVLLAVLAWMWLRPSSAEPVAVSPSPAATPVPGVTDPPDEPEPTAIEPPAPAAAPPDATAGATGASGITTSISDAVAAAGLCRSLTTRGPDWQCEAPGSPIEPGPLVFYTRVRTPRSTTVQHRWFHGTALRQTVDLEVAANAGAGYRTFSRLTVAADRAGTWRVELRSEDGELLHQQEFVVR